jgi:hypothetical protein
MADTEREHRPNAPPEAAAGPDAGEEACEVPADLLELLVCPLGKADLRLEKNTLVCTRCGPVFQIDDGIPILLIDEAKLPEGIGSIDELPCQKER